MTKILVTIILIATILTSCNLVASDDYDLTVTFNNADGLMTNSHVRLNGLTIGKIKSIKLGQDNRIITTISIDKEVSLSVDSRVILVKDFLGTASIDVRPGISEEVFKDGQEIEGEQQKLEGVNADNAIGLVEELLNPKKNSTQDSILIELRKLNKNIEKLLDKK